MFITDPDTDEKLHECETCNGLGGWDKSRDCEVYDDWEDCPDCDGTGWEQNI
jgi:DnaJ-class molecular chaperone